MTEQIEIGDPPIQIMVKRSTRARRYSLRMSDATGAVNLTVPRFANLEAAIEFARMQEGWIRKHLSKRVKPQTLNFGNTILFDGAECEIRQGTGRSVRYEDGILYAPGQADKLAAKLRGYYKTIARERMVAASVYYADKLARPIGRVTIRDTRSRWGSCTSEGNLMYSWRLIMAPRQVQAYVAAHEVCHLIEMNHSQAYWALVASIFPEYKERRQWLKQNGALLHRYAF